MNNPYRNSSTGQTAKQRQVYLAKLSVTLFLRHFSKTAK